MQMVEGCHQLQGFGHQQAIAEYVAGHVANADHADHVGLHVDAALTEMTLHRYPGTTGRYAHLLVVVTRRAARGEGIAKPEVVLGGNAVGNVGKTRRTLVRGNHQIGIIAVVTQHVGGWNHLALAQVVGDIQQPADEDAIAGDGFGLNIVTRAGGRQPPRHEATLGPTRDDDRVLYLLSLDQAEHLGAVVLLAIRPAQPATGHLATAQVYALDPR